MSELGFLALQYIVRGVLIVLGIIAIQYIRKYNLEKWVRVGVRAAEEVYGSGEGPIKKKSVIDFIINTMKFKISKKQLNTLIDSVVFDEFNRFKDEIGIETQLK